MRGETQTRGKFFLGWRPEYISLVDRAPTPRTCVTLASRAHQPPPHPGPYASASLAISGTCIDIANCCIYLCGRLHAWGGVRGREEKVEGERREPDLSPLSPLSPLYLLPLDLSPFNDRSLLSPLSPFDLSLLNLSPSSPFGLSLLALSPLALSPLDQSMTCPFEPPHSIHLSLVHRLSISVLSSLLIYSRWPVVCVFCPDLV